ncbi:MAG: hypothetical protein ABII18_02305 [bacterium]
MTTVKIPWQGRVISAQPRIRLLRSFDESSHSYLGYESLPACYDIYQGVWPEVERLRADITLSNFKEWFELKVVEEVWDLGEEPIDE